ncbi:MAG TPA: peptide chain release factor N(5)-glutamine methyltransferase [Candidatus Nanopelagicaceae bacterium]|nr:peptide chain release factor N(5)-glutamine methyltransferase [Candidatus Nanopelagicaceae bacterium]
MKTGHQRAAGRGDDAQPSPPTLLSILRQSTGYLQEAGLDQPRLEAELLLAYCLGVSRLDLYLQFERRLLAPELSRIRPLLRSRARGMPFAYITGRKEFFGLAFEVGEGVLVPRPETELLVELGVVAAGTAAQIRCADLGCGSGCAGIAIAARLPAALVDTVDLDPAAVEFSRRNAIGNGVQERVAVLQGSWAAPLRDRGPYQLIVSNPPYVTSAEWADLNPGVRDYEPKMALDGGSDGLDSYRELLPGVAAVAAPGATILLEGDPRRMAALDRLCADLWPQSERRVHQDLSGRDRVLEVRLRG